MDPSNRPTHIRALAMEVAREAHWQAEWAHAGLSEAKRVPSREKFYALVAYPGSSGFLHLGHLRGLVIGDALHRFHRMLGHQVFFPTGTHASGLPAVTFAQKVKDRDRSTVAQLEENGVPKGEWTRLEDPSEAARFLGQQYLEVFRRSGFLLDERSYLTTIDEDYRAFIGWQFRRLRDKSALVQAPHFAPVCPVCGPVSVDPSETDLSSGGEAEVIEYVTIPFDLADGRSLLCATLRPETIFGVTNLWLHPTEPLITWRYQDHAYLVSRRGGERLVDQHGGELGEEVDPESLLGQTVRVPIAGGEVRILSSSLVQPSVGSGVVMSVPAHAPVDWLGIQELGPSDRAFLTAIPTIIEIEPGASLTPSERKLVEGEGVPAERAARATGARSLGDDLALTEATERLYRLEYGRGRLVVASLKGTSVVEARERVSAELARSGRSFELQEFSEPVVCRRGHEVVIRRVPDQWFLRYSDPKWKEAVRDLASRMLIRPDPYRSEFPEIIDWFRDRPCTRRGRWLGTPFPFDPSWIIEPIADSTFYPAYYIVRRFVSAGRVPISALTDAFFDFVFLDKGPGEPTLEPAIQTEIREEFRYWYPLDFNIGGKEHKRVHFPVFAYTHALLLPPELQPRGIFVHWWLTGPGGAKVSKKEGSKKGRAIPPIRRALDHWGADVLRYMFAQAASPFQDVEWNPALVDTARDRLDELERLVQQPMAPGEAVGELSLWLETEMRGIVERVRAAFEVGNLREVAELVYVRVPLLLRRYHTRGGGDPESESRIRSIWIRLMSPITPHLAEELGQSVFPALVATQPFPTVEELRSSAAVLVEERYLETVEEDLRNVLKLSQSRGESPDSVYFYVAASWKATLESWLQGSPKAEEIPSVRELMERVQRHPELSAYRSEIPTYVERVRPVLQREASRAPVPPDEVGVLRRAAGYLGRRYRFGHVAVLPESEAEELDPLHRRERSRPGHPAFYLHSAPVHGTAE